MSSGWEPADSGDAGWNTQDDPGPQTMSSTWEPVESGNAELNTQDDPGLQQGDGDAWTSDYPQANGNDENENPYAGSGGNDNACHNCGALDHFARECPNAPSRACYNCGEEGHNKADCPHPPRCGNCGKEGHMKAECPEPQVVKGPCRYCNEEGHHVANCPTKPPTICKNCKGEGHMAKDCKENRQLDKSGIADMTTEEAWAKLKQASDDRDLDDFREAFDIYTKAAPEATFVDIETKMREENFNIWTIAMEKQSFDVYSLIDLQGQMDREYVAGFYFSDKAPRKALQSRWPTSPEENLERLANAGFPLDRGVPKCHNCGELGHISARCKQEKVERGERVEIKCANCGEIGHRVRDCKEKRINKFGCRNCGSDEHQAKDCPEPRSAADVECRRCGRTGHFAKDCPEGGGGQGGGRACHNCGSEDHFARDCDQPRNDSAMICRNCDQPGHAARDCPEPKNWSKVQCNQCGEFGHTVRRCPQSGGDFGSGEAGPGGYGGNESGHASGDTWQPQDSQTDQNEQNDWNNKPFEQELSDKLAHVSWKSNADTQKPQYGW